MDILANFKVEVPLFQTRLRKLLRWLFWPGRRGDCGCLAGREKTQGEACEGVS